VIICWAWAGFCWTRCAASFTVSWAS
jgi:hypothetical protein